VLEQYKSPFPQYKQQKHFPLLLSYEFLDYGARS
jgi:hypothetical protein